MVQTVLIDTFSLDAARVTRLAVRNTLGEGVVWDDRLSRLLWTDIPERRLYIHVWEGETRTLPLPRQLCAISLTDDPDRLVCAWDVGFGTYDISTGEARLTHPIDFPDASMRLNDGRTDRDGVFWCSAMSEHPGASGPQARLYGFDGDEVVERRDDLHIGNGLGFCARGPMYLSCSGQNIIWRYDDTRMLNPTVFARPPRGEHPDGGTVDADGHYWSAQWGAGRVVRYSLDGKVEASVAIDCRYATCLTFCGPGLRHIAITSAARDVAKPGPGDGALTIFKTNVQGLSEPRFSGPIPD